VTSESELSALERLADLRSRGMLSEEQYETQKARILDRKPAGSRTAIFVGIGLLLVAIVTAVAILLTRSPSSGLTTPSSNPPTPMAASGTPTAAPSPTPSATPSADPDTPRGRGVTSTADPIAQDASSTAGMTLDTTLSVAGKQVVLFKKDGDGAFDTSYVLMVGKLAQVLEDGAIYSISKTGSYVVLQSDSGGTACPADFQIVDVAGGRITKSFGTCSDLIRSRETADGSLISIVHSFNVGGPVTAKYSRGTLTVWGDTQ